MCSRMNRVHTMLEAWSRSSVVGVATSYGLDGPGFESRQGYEIFSSLKRPDRLWGPPSLLLDECRVKHELTTLTHVLLHGVNRESFELTRDTHLMQQFIIIIHSSTCFGHLYAHLQEYQVVYELYYPIWCPALCVVAEVLRSRCVVLFTGVSCVSLVNSYMMHGHTYIKKGKALTFDDDDDNNNDYCLFVFVKSITI